MQRGMAEGTLGLVLGQPVSIMHCALAARRAFCHLPSALGQWPTWIIPPMRINLVTPFAEKDAVNALGARWDASKKLWYIVNVTDLTPFLRWIPNMEAAMEGSDAAPQMTKPRSSPPKPTKDSAPSTPVIEVPHCGCNVLPWEDCVHTAIS